MYSVNLKKNGQSESTLRNSMVLYPTVFRLGLQRDSLVLKSIKCSVINIRRSMLDVRPARNALKPVRGKSNYLIHNSMIMLIQRTMHGRRVLDVRPARNALKPV